MAFFNVGDKVTVRADLSREIGYGSYGDSKPNNCFVVPDMLRQAGKQVTIRTVYQTRLHNTRYRIAEDNGVWAWADEMFEEYIQTDREIAVEPPSEEEVFAFLMSG